MKIASIELREIRLPLVHFFETSFGRTTERRILLVRVRDAGGAEGWGECTAGENPFYCEEWTESAWSVIKDYLAPLTVGREVESAAEVFALMRAVRGNRMAKAAIETACWELEARRAHLPLWKLIGGERTEIACGVSIGIQNSPDALLEKIACEVEAGYRRIKIKIKPGWDVAIVERVRAAFPDIALSVDANAAYAWIDDLPLLRQLDQFKLLMIEQPFAFDDLLNHAELQRELHTPVCLDETIRSFEDARTSVYLHACRIVNVKLGRVGGHAEARRIELMCRNAGIPVWCGGMLESGIGRAHNIAMSTLAGFSLPGDVSASARYWAEDIIEPPVTVSPQGTITAPITPGLGFQINLKRIESLTVRRESFSAP